MPTLLLTHPAFLDHDTSPGHPERPDRLRAIAKALAHGRFARLQRSEAPIGALEQIGLAHPPAYAGTVRRRIPESGFSFLDADTTVSPGSWEAALRAVGAACAAVDAVMGGTAKNAFCAVRPPGHHAETARAMGFCLFNNAAIAARWAQKRHGAERVAIVDFDVHHGNGTQEIFWSDATVMYCSTHQMPLYPGTGAKSETGVGNIFNAPLSPGDGGPEFREAFETEILPRLEDFAPDIVIVSAGFDAHRRDPLANLRLAEPDFAWATERLMEIARRRADGRLVSLLEGGYDLQGLSASVAVHVETLMGA